MALYFIFGVINTGTIQNTNRSHFRGLADHEFA